MTDLGVEVTAEIFSYDGGFVLSLAIGRLCYRIDIDIVTQEQRRF